MLHPRESLSLPCETLNLRFVPMWWRDPHIPALSAFQSDGLKPSFRHGSQHCGIMRRAAPECQDELSSALFKLAYSRKSRSIDAEQPGANFVVPLDATDWRTRMEPMDILADTRRYLDAAIRQLAAVEAGAPIARPLTREEAINIVTEQIGLFESVLRRYGSRQHADRT